MIHLVVSAEPSVNTVMTIVTVAFVGLIAVGIVIRVIVAARRRTLRELRQTVARPLADSAAVESTAYGWRPAAQTDADSRDGRSGDQPER